MSLILLDTHVALWAAHGQVKGPASKLIDAAAATGELLLSPISAWEIGMLVRKGRLTLDSPPEEWIQRLFALPGIVTAVLTPAIAVAAASLSGNIHGDPADRVLISTAAAYGARFMTRDRRIHEYSKSARWLRCIRC